MENHYDVTHSDVIKVSVLGFLNKVINKIQEGYRRKK